MERQIIEDLCCILKDKADEWEVFYSLQEGISIEAKEGTIESMKVSCNKGIGIRTLKDCRLGFSFTTDLSDNALVATVDNAVASGTAAAKDESYAFPLSTNLESKELGFYDKLLADAPKAQKIEKALLLEKSAVSFDKRIKRVRNAVYSETTLESHLINSNGVSLLDKKTFVTASIMAAAEQDGDAQMGWEMDFSHYADDVDAEKVGKGAAKRAVSMLGAREMKSTKCPVVLENSTVVEFLECLAPSFLADNLHKGKSLLKDKKGKKIFSDSITILDNGLLNKGWGTSLFDAEGVPRQKTCLVSDGVLEGYLYDTYWANRMRVKSTGNSSRGGFKSVPAVSVSNVYIENGNMTLDALIRETWNGIFITGLLGVHTVNTISGDFSLGATGFYIEDGTVSYPVRAIAIAGNLMDLFSRVDKVGNDIRFFGSIGAPSLVLHEMDISGTG